MRQLTPAPQFLLFLSCTTFPLLLLLLLVLLVVLDTPFPLLLLYFL
jgi:hypothetical protein